MALSEVYALSSVCVDAGRNSLTEPENINTGPADASLTEALEYTLEKTTEALSRFPLNT